MGVKREMVSVNQGRLGTSGAEEEGSCAYTKAWTRAEISSRSGHPQAPHVGGLRQVLQDLKAHAAPADPWMHRNMG